MRVTGQDPYYKAKKWRNEKWQRFIIKEDCNLSLLDGKTIAIIGYGSTGTCMPLT